MKIPDQMVVSTRAFVQLQAKLAAYVAQLGVESVERHLDAIQLRMTKRDGKYLGAYIESKVCQEFKITRFELMDSKGRQHITEARQILCVLVEKHLKYTKTDISTMFHRTRHFAKRMITDFNKKLADNHPLDQKLIERYKRLDLLVAAYMDFKPNTNAR